MTSFRSSAFVALVLAAGGLLACKRGGSVGAEAGAPSATAAPPPPVAPTIVHAAPPANAPTSFADLAAKADPAVVFVRTLTEQTGRTGRRRVLGQGLGSAFVYDADGLILTNAHVIQDATDIRVVFNRKKLMRATVVGSDPPTDIAVLRVDAKGLPHLPLGDSDVARVGDWVVAIGNPFGLSHTVSSGIISAKGRTGDDVRGLGNGDGYFNFLQTDAGINPGNSGGPLLDTAGRVVGINTAIRANANGIGFAIPINMVKELLPRLIKDGKITRSAIGISVSGVDADDVERLKRPDDEGALVRFVLPGGPADGAGVRADDVVVAFEGQRVTGPEQLRWLASLAGVGKTVSVEVARGTRTLDLKLTLNELKPGAAEAPAPPPPPAPSVMPFP